MDHGGRSKEGQDVGESLELQVGSRKCARVRGTFEFFSGWNLEAPKPTACSHACCSPSRPVHAAGGEAGAALHQRPPAHPAGPPQRRLRRFQIRPRRSCAEQGRNTRPSVSTSKKESCMCFPSPQAHPRITCPPPSIFFAKTHHIPNFFHPVYRARRLSFPLPPASGSPTSSTLSTCASRTSRW